ncbi:ABC transporter permease subunit [Paenibacillus pasadenensis]|uniref:ABC transporter permease n=1 Tax=Paenibacillus pasadenensis TaxID=217090 RepID=UPI00203ACCB3|nr:ABC transporter permease subunit [Paenibacillus pasadenensis]MCM3746420.1 ABC transporter permease subunit [Paenibacillus pasadenensis]
MKPFKISYRFKAQFELQSMVWPGLLFVFIFAYLPMYGVMIAFQQFDFFTLIENANANIFKIFASSEFVGLQNFKEFIHDDSFWPVLRNTLGINILGLIFGFPIPIIFALLLNEITSAKFKKTVQTVSYLPHFVSWVIFGGMVLTSLSADRGVVNAILVGLGLFDSPVEFMANPDYFWTVAVVSGIIKSFGFGAVLYIAAIAGVDQDLYEAASIDGCGRFRKIIDVTLPSIMGTVVIMLIFSVSGILDTGFDQIIVLQNSLNVEMSETIDTYVYKLGVGQMRYSYSAAVGLAKSVIALILVFLANYLAKRISGKGIM